MITYNAFKRARLTKADNEILPELGRSFEFEREPNEQTALAMCFSSCCEHNRRLQPLSKEDCEVFAVGWLSHRENRLKAQEDWNWPIAVFVSAVKAGKVTTQDRTAFFCGWNGAALWANEHVADVLE